jgi:ribosomal protein S18 acetylase RimI-like enzyme
MQIFKATPLDARAIAQIHVTAWKEAYKCIIAAEYLAALSIDKRQSYWCDVISEGSPELVVAKVSDIVVGWVAFGHCRDVNAPATAGEIWAIYVAPDYWSTGVGKALWLQAKQKLAAGGYRTVSLWVLADNAMAIDFYKRVGFTAEHGSAKAFKLGCQTLREVRYVANLVDCGS